MYVQFDLPEIPQQRVSSYWLKLVFIGSASSRYQINALTSTYVRLVESCLFEYQAGSTRLMEFWSTHTSINLGAMHNSISHFESCLTNAYRAINCYRRLRKGGKNEPISIHLNADRPSFVSDAVANRFREIRNRIHHLDTAVLKREITEGQSFMLNPSGPEMPHPTEANQTIKTIDRLAIGDLEVRFSELADLLVEMQKFAVCIADFLPDNSQRAQMSKQPSPSAVHVEP